MDALRGTAIRHHGAVEGVTGLCHELVTPEGSVLVDCGLFQGADLAAQGGGPAIDFDVAGVRALVVTHCHLDHVGRLPYLFAAGFRGPVYCSEATARLLPLVIEDAFEIGFTRDRRLIGRFLQLLEGATVPVSYGQWKSLPNTNVSLRLQPAGHILGSAYVEFEVGAAAKAVGRGVRVVFSGDLGPPYIPLLPAPKPPRRADLLVLESTYGDRLHEVTCPQV